MSRVLPILFNTEMVQAILDGRKMVTRRAVKYKYSNTEMQMFTNKYGTRLIEIQKDIEGETHGKNPDGSTWHKLLPYIEKNPPYKKGDILYVRETWAHIPCIDCCADESGICGERPVTYEDRHSVSEGCFIYRVDYPEQDRKRVCWSPSIHMPKQAARIWLKVTDVRVERLQEITDEWAIKEGLREVRYDVNTGQEESAALEWFPVIWDSTIKKADIDKYGWNANPWVWVVEFERCEKPTPCTIKGIEPASDKRPCIGYQKSKEDDEPCEMCKGCKWCDGEEPESEG